MGISPQFFQFSAVERPLTETPFFGRIAGFEDFPHLGVVIK
jgi:hypothetical protein